MWILERYQCCVMCRDTLVCLCRLPGGRVESVAMYSSAKRSIHLDHKEK